MASPLQDFLEGTSSNATLRQIDFEKTTPAIPAYKDHFTVLIDNFLSPEECAQLLLLAEQSTGDRLWERARVNIGNNEEVMTTERRNCGRILWDTPIIADRLLARLLPFLEQCGIDTVRDKPLVTGKGPAKRGEVFRASSLNGRLRFLRYEGGEYFRPHFDGTYVTPDEKERSLFTIHLYLNGDGEQDLKALRKRIKRAEANDGLFDIGDEDHGAMDDSESDSESDSDDGELLGGATSFYDGYDADDGVRVFPKTGSLLIFQQRNLIHGGDDVFRGVKYTMRADVMYCHVP